MCGKISAFGRFGQIRGRSKKGLPGGSSELIGGSESQGEHRENSLLRG